MDAKCECRGWASCLFKWFPVCTTAVMQCAYMCWMWRSWLSNPNGMVWHFIIWRTNKSPSFLSLPLFPLAAFTLSYSTPIYLERLKYLGSTLHFTSHQRCNCGISNNTFNILTKVKKILRKMNTESNRGIRGDQIFSDTQDFKTFTSAGFFFFRNEAILVCAPVKNRSEPRRRKTQSTWNLTEDRGSLL